MNKHLTEEELKEVEERLDMFSEGLKDVPLASELENRAGVFNLCRKLNFGQAPEDIATLFVMQLYSWRHEIDKDFLIEFRYIPTNRRRKTFSKFYAYGEIKQNMSEILKPNSSGYNIFVGVNPRPRSKEKKQEYITDIIALWADVDSKNFKEGKEEAWKHIEQTQLPTTMTVESGNGFHLYWVLEEPLINRGEKESFSFKQIMMGLSVALNGDSVHDFSRVMRLPGSYNLKDPDNPKPCNIRQLNPNIFFSPEDFEDFPAFDVLEKQESVDLNELGDQELIINKPEDAEKLNINKSLKRFIDSRSHEGYDSRSERDQAMITDLIRSGYNLKTIESIFLNSKLKISERILEYGRWSKERLKGDVSKALSFIKEKNLSTKQSERPNIIKLSEVKSQPLSWLWFNRIPSGNLSLLVGDPGAGKSLLTIWMGAKISRGEDWPDRAAEGSGSVILLTAEDDLEDTVKVRAERAGADCSKISVLQPKEYYLESILEDLRYMLNEIEDLKLVIIDPIDAYMSGVKGNDNIGVRSALAPLSEFASKNKITVLAVQHLNKDQAKKAIYRTMGSVAYTAAARSVWLVQRDEDDKEGKKRLFVPLKANNCKDPTTLAFKIDGPIGNPEIEFEPEPVPINADELLADEEMKGHYSAIGEAKLFIKEALKNGPMESKQVLKEAKENAISEATLNRAKAKMGVESYKEGDEWFWRFK